MSRMGIALAVKAKRRVGRESVVKSFICEEQGYGEFNLKKDSLRELSYLDLGQLWPLKCDCDYPTQQKCPPSLPAGTLTVLCVASHHFKFMLQKHETRYISMNKLPFSCISGETQR